MGNYEHFLFEPNEQHQDGLIWYYSIICFHIVYIYYNN